MVQNFTEGGKLGHFRVLSQEDTYCVCKKKSKNANVSGTILTKRPKSVSPRIETYHRQTDKVHYKGQNSIHTQIERSLTK